MNRAHASFVGSLGVVLAVLALSCTAWAEGSQSSYAPKLYFRTGFGTLTNAGELKGTVSSVGSVNVAAQKFLSPSVSLGLSYQADLDVTSGTMPLRGFDLTGRWFWRGIGTRVRNGVSSQSYGFLPVWAPYSYFAIQQRSYFFKSMDTSASSTETLNGSYAAFGIGAGVDRQLGDGMGLNVELGWSPISFSQSDERIAFRTVSILFGISQLL